MRKTLQVSHYQLLSLKKAIKYLGPNAILYEGTGNKKYKIFDENNLKWVQFGNINYKDFTFTNDLNKRKNYLSRSSKIKGDWEDNKYSPNNLSIHILW